VFDKSGNRVKQVWDLLAYLGRYGHQPLNVTRNMPLRELRMLSQSIAEIVEQENAPVRRSAGMDY
jgi:hypothetical protein